jgi:phage terminase large subunit-like protein
MTEEQEAILKMELPLYFMTMNRAQRPFIRYKNKEGRTPKRRLLEHGNKAGKTRIGIAEDIAHAIGVRPWLGVDDPDYKVDVKLPNNGLIGCETMVHSVAEKIEPELRRLIPKHCNPVFKPGAQGTLMRVTIPNDLDGKKLGSVIHLRSYDQSPDDFEGLDYDWIHWDEPPPEKILNAAERGKIVTNAPSWFTMTPLKEPYIYDKYSLHAGNLGGDDDEIAVFRGSIWDNCRDYCRPCDLIIKENEYDRNVKRCPKCNLIMGFIPRAGILEYLKTIDPDERKAREEGMWAHLSGLVYKELDREKHIYEDFPIPKSWTKIEVVDPHDARPTRWLFGAIAPEEIEIYGKIRNRIYWYTYLLADGNVDTIARKVKAHRETHGYSKPKMVVLDAKFGTKTTKTRMDETTWEDELNKAGIDRIKLSHSNPGDIAIGHKIVKEYLKDHYSSLTGKGLPGMLFAKEGCHGLRSPINDMFNYQWKEGTEKPQEEYKDFCDCVRYGALEQPIWSEQENDKKVISLLTERNERSMTVRRHLTAVAS